MDVHVYCILAGVQNLLTPHTVRASADVLRRIPLRQFPKITCCASVAREWINFSSTSKALQARNRQSNKAPGQSLKYRYCHRLCAIFQKY